MTPPITRLRVSKRFAREEGGWSRVNRAEIAIRRGEDVPQPLPRELRRTRSPGIGGVSALGRSLQALSLDTSISAYLASHEQSGGRSFREETRLCPQYARGDEKEALKAASRL